MGCDIHTFLEYSDFTDQDGNPYWQCFGDRYNPGRNYTLFGVIAGVRDDTHQLFEPRGLPEGKLSYSVYDYMRIRIADEGEEPTDGECSLEQAQSWASSYGETIINDAKGKPRWVTNPDLHNHSWLTLAEVKEALQHYLVSVNELPDVKVDEVDRGVVMEAAAALKGTRLWRYDVGWDAIVAAMEAFEARGCQTRLIFCFDN